MKPPKAATTRPPDGAATLTDLHSALTTYVVLPTAEAADAVTLWIATTHAIDAFQHAPRLAIKSPEKRCGKSRLLDVIEGTCHDPLISVNATVAAIFRRIGDEVPPTLLVDEADTMFGNKRVAEQNEDLRGLLNAGHQRGRPALRCVGPSQTPTEFHTFAMAALAGIGDLPDTITDRAVNITMRRRRQEEKVSTFRSRRDGPVLHELRDRLESWTHAVGRQLADAEPDLPVEDRAADTWEPLVAVADAAGGDWPARARRACLLLTAEADEADEEASLTTKLLSDIRDVFTQMEVSFISSTDLIEALGKIEESPWGEWELTPRKLAYRLKHFGIGTKRNTTGTGRGYRIEDLTDAFQRYLRQEASEASETPEFRENPSDASGRFDASKRQTENKRQTEKPGMTGNLTGLTLSDATSVRCRVHGVDAPGGRCPECMRVAS